MMEIKSRTQDALKAYRSHKVRSTVRAYTAVFWDREGTMLRRHAVNMASLYLDMRRDYRELIELLDKAIANDQAQNDQAYGGSHD